MKSHGAIPKTVVPSIVVPRTYDTLILSDLHLGADMSRAREALQVLQDNQYRRLILLGDIFADLNFGRLKKEHWKFLGYIRKLSNPKRKVEVVSVEGNHDHGLTEFMSHLVGFRVYQEYQWEYQGKRHIAVHGHQFDGFVVSNVRVSYLIGTLLYLQLQKWDSKNKTLTRFLDRLGTSWQRLSPKVADALSATPVIITRRASSAAIPTRPCRRATRSMESSILIAEPGLMRVLLLLRLTKRECRSMNMWSDPKIFISRPSRMHLIPKRMSLAITRSGSRTGNSRAWRLDIAFRDAIITKARSLFATSKGKICAN